MTVTATDRAVYTTRKHRAADLLPGDVTRNRFGKWDVVEQVATLGDDARYIEITFEVGGSILMRTVHLVDVQIPKPS